MLVGAGSVVADARTGGALGGAGIALAFAAAVTAAVYAFGHVSGAHINPAVTFGFWSAGHFPGREVLPYVVAQCAGATAAAFALVAAWGRGANGGATLPRVPLAEAFLLEWLFSLILMSMIAVVASGGAVPRLAGAAVIGLTVGLAAFLGGSATGASMNPARSLGPALAAGAWEAHWLYWAAPITGMVAAVQVLARIGAWGPSRGSRGDAVDAALREERLGVEGPLAGGEQDRS